MSAKRIGWKCEHPSLWENDFGETVDLIAKGPKFVAKEVEEVAARLLERNVATAMKDSRLEGRHAHLSAVRRLLKKRWKEALSEKRQNDIEKCCGKRCLDKQAPRRGQV